MKQWDIFSFQPTGWPEPHPAVVVSHPLRVTHKPEVDVVICSSKRAGRPAEGHEVMLDQEDGLDWPTLCKCDLLYTVPKSALRERRGTVTQFRRREIVRRIIAAHGWVE
ncbi:MAG: type II toxin-antitoxin system PemK/MazF family toxin [Verrucomicrobiota bacterium]